MNNHQPGEAMPDLETTQPLDVNAIVAAHAVAELNRIADFYNNCRIREHTETLTKRLTELEGRDITTDPLALILDAFATGQALNGQLHGEIEYDDQAFNTLAMQTPNGFTVTLTRIPARP